MNEKPNIIMLVNDHQAYYRHGWDSGVRPKRPHFEKLMEEGVFFDRYYAVAPLCVPIRTTLLTGLYPHNHKNVCNNTNAPFNHDLIFDAFSKADYQNYYFGKWHAGAGIPSDYGADGFSREGYGNPYLSREYKKYLEEMGLEMPKRKIEKVFTSEDFLIQHPDLVSGNEDYISNKDFSGENAVGISKGPKESHESFFLAHSACESLKDIKNNRGKEPFFMRVDFWGPHHPHFPSQEFVDMYNPEDISLYESFSDDLSDKPEIYRESYAPLLGEDGKLKIPNPLPDEDWKLICARAFAHISQIDAAGGKIIDMLDSPGLKENTIVIWTTDHGDALASHGGQWDKGSYMTEEVMRVPLVLRYPGHFPEGSQSNALINTVDMPATLVDFAGTSFEKPIVNFGYNGLMKASEEFGVEVKAIESSTVSEYETNLASVGSMGFDLVFGLGSALSDAVRKIAPSFPDTMYIVIDGNIDDNENVLSINYREEQSAFLAGALAAKMTSTGTIGFVLGMRIPVLERFEVGFVADALQFKLQIIPNNPIPGELMLVLPYLLTLIALIVMKETKAPASIGKFYDRNVR